jgi:hypothetical protein
MPDYRRGIGTVDPQKLCHVVAFDPGETTGWCVMGIHPDQLIGGPGAFKELQHGIAYIDYGQIDCVGTGGWDDVVHKHAGISFGAEAVGVSKMMDLIWKLPDPAIVVEDFIIDFSKIDQARHTLSPVRIMSMLSYAMYIDAEMPFYSKLFIQNRSMAKTTCADKRLQRWGLFDRTGGRHARDATRHAFYFLRTCHGGGQKSAENRWRAWPDKFGDPWKQERYSQFTGSSREPEDSLESKPLKPRRIAKGERVRFAK